VAQATRTQTPQQQLASIIQWAVYVLIHSFFMNIQCAPDDQLFMSAFMNSMLLRAFNKCTIKTRIDALMITIAEFEIESGKIQPNVE